MREIVLKNVRLGEVKTEFFLKHADNRERNFLVTAEDEISALLDWEWYVFVYSQAHHQGFHDYENCCVRRSNVVVRVQV
jgi:hypothetical protein